MEAEAICARIIWLPSKGNNNKQKLTHKNHTYNEAEGSRHNNNNHPEIYNNDQEQPNEMNDDKQILSSKLPRDDYNTFLTLINQA
jgi:hypothetical protein